MSDNAPTCPLHETPMEFKSHHQGRELWKCPKCSICIDRPKPPESK